jgi:hypothetical protein
MQSIIPGAVFKELHEAYNPWEEKPMVEESDIIEKLVAQYEEKIRPGKQKK